MNLIARTVLAAASLLFSNGAVAGDVTQNLDANSVILKGYDAVAYQTQGAPIEGSTEFTAVHNGAIYRFANAENRDTFNKNPEKYAPAFGGYCAMGVVFSRKFDVEPTAFRVVDGTLYMNLNEKVQSRWVKDIPGNIQRAEANWPTIVESAPEELK